MNHAQGQSFLDCAVGDLQEAAWVPRGHDWAVCRANVFEFALQKLGGHFRLNQVVNARAAATPGALRELDELEVRNRPQHLTGRGGDPLRVAEVAGFVIGDTQRGPGALCRRLDANLREPLGYL